MTSKHIHLGNIHLTTGKLEVGDLVYVWNQPATVTKVIGRVKENIDGRRVWAQAVLATSDDSKIEHYLVNLDDFSWNWS